MLRVWVSAIVLSCFGAAPAIAQLPDDLQGPAEPAAEIVGLFDSICLEGDGNLSVPWKLAKDAGWIEAPKVPFERYYWGIMPHDRIGLVSNQHPGLILLLSAQGNVSPEQRQAYAAGGRPSSDPIEAGRLVDTPRMLGIDMPPKIGTTECRLSGRVTDLGSLYPAAEPLIHPPGTEGRQMQYSRTGTTDHTGAHEVIYQNLSSHITLSMGYAAPDGSGGFHLFYERAISPGEPMDVYTWNLSPAAPPTASTTGTAPH